MIRVLIVASFLLLFIGTNSVAQKGILRAGDGWFRLQQQVIVSDNYFDSDEKLISIRTNGIFLTSITGEYGLTPRITATAYIPFFATASLNSINYNQSGKTEPGKLLRSFGDSEIGFKYGFALNKRFQANGILTFGLPFGKKGRVGTAEDIQTGDGEFNQLAGLELRFKIHERFSVGGYCAFNNRSNDFSDEIRYGFDLQYEIRKFTGSIHLSVVESLFNNTAPVSLNGIFSNHREFLSPGLNVRYALAQRVSFYASSDFFPAGRNTLASPLIGIGFQWAIQPSAKQ